MENYTFGTKDFYHLPLNLLGGSGYLDEDSLKRLEIDSAYLDNRYINEITWVCIDYLCQICFGNDPDCPLGGHWTVCTPSGGGGGGGGNSFPSTGGNSGDGGSGGGSGNAPNSNCQNYKAWYSDDYQRLNSTCDPITNPSIFIEPDPNLILNFSDGNEIDLESYFRCFDLIPNDGAVYSATLSADLPSNGNHLWLINNNLRPGHAFITMKKTNGNQSATISFGFYPKTQYVSIVNLPVVSEFRNDQYHEANAQLLMPNISALDFNTIRYKARLIQNSNQFYDLDDNNCTDIALEIFNVIRPNNPVVIADSYGDIFGYNYGKTPNALWYKIKNTPSGRTGVMHAAKTTGPC